MYDNLVLKTTVANAIKCLDDSIVKLTNCNNSANIGLILKKLPTEIENSFDSIELIKAIEDAGGYLHNQFSELKNSQSIFKAKERTLKLLKTLKIKLNSDSFKYINPNNNFSKVESLFIIKKLLQNFHFHINNMYNKNVHGKCSFSKSDLDKITIGNEYDVQHILFSIIKPLFPDALLEVPDNTGCSNIRYDIEIPSCSTTIEVKCTRDSMPERSLNEEMGSDGFHYKRENIFFFVYDKENLIQNIDKYKEEYNKIFFHKNIDITIIQPIRL